MKAPQAPTYNAGLPKLPNCTAGAEETHLDIRGDLAVDVADAVNAVDVETGLPNNSVGRPPLSTPVGLRTPSPRGNGSWQEDHASGESDASEGDGFISPNKKSCCISIRNSCRSFPQKCCSAFFKCLCCPCRTMETRDDEFGINGVCLILVCCGCMAFLIYLLVWCSQHGWHVDGSGSGEPGTMGRPGE